FLQVSRPDLSHAERVRSRLGQGQAGAGAARLRRRAGHRRGALGARFLAWRSSLQRRAGQRRGRKRFLHRLTPPTTRRGRLCAARGGLLPCVKARLVAALRSYRPSVANAPDRGESQSRSSVDARRRSAAETSYTPGMTPVVVFGGISVVRCFAGCGVPIVVVA